MGDDKIDHRLDQYIKAYVEAGLDRKVRVIILLQDGSGSAREEREVQAQPIRASIIDMIIGKKGDVLDTFWIINAISAKVPVSFLHQLAERSEVVSITYDELGVVSMI